MMKVTASFIATAILLTGSICAYSQSEISVYGGSTRQIPINDLTTEGEIVFLYYTPDARSLLEGVSFLSP